jgi:hypothetical protein
MVSNGNAIASNGRSSFKTKISNRKKSFRDSNFFFFKSRDHGFKTVTQDI